MIRLRMHPIANQVEIPTEQIEAALIARAVPGFKGSVSIGVRVKREAGLEVEFPIETRCFHQVNVTKDLAMPTITNERVSRVRRMLMEHAHLFRLGTKLSQLVAHFDNGELQKLEVIEAE